MFNQADDEAMRTKYLNDLPKLFETLKVLQEENVVFKAVLKGVFTAAESAPGLQSAISTAVTSFFPHPRQRVAQGKDKFATERAALDQLLPESLKNLLPKK